MQYHGSMWKKYDTKESWTDSKSMEYHQIQWHTPKESTKNISKVLSPWLGKSENVIDIGCGAGAVTAYLASQFPGTMFYGIDKHKSLINIAEQKSKQAKIANIQFMPGNIYKLPKKRQVDGVILTQTILLFKDYPKPMRNIFTKMRPKWVAITGLFYEGEISLYVKAVEYKKNRTVNLNTYSINRFSDFCLENGYKTVLNEPFEMPIDIEKPSDPNYLGTYTQRLFTTDNSIRRIQITGPLLQNWRTLVLENIR